MKCSLARTTITDHHHLARHHSAPVSHRGPNNVHDTDVACAPIGPLIMLVWWQTQQWRANGRTLSSCRCSLGPPAGLHVCMADKRVCASSQPELILCMPARGLFMAATTVSLTSCQRRMLCESFTIRVSSEAAKLELISGTCHCCRSHTSNFCHRATARYLDCRTK